ASEDASDTSSDDLVTVTVGSSFTGTRFNLTETRTLFDSSAVCTDGFKVVSIPSETGYAFAANSQPIATSKVTGDSAKIKLSGSAKNTTLKVTVPKSVPSGTTAYFIVWHNSYNVSNNEGRSYDGNGVGYQLIKVTKK
nr:hypothetical protein [Lachnospiraceae bacterium]